MTHFRIIPKLLLLVLLTAGAHQLHGQVAAVLYYESGAHAFPTEATPALERVLDTLLQLRDYQLRIEGHTDDIGSDPFNCALAEHRAQTVYLRLLQLGADPKRTTYSVHGEDRPLNHNRNADERRLNRRVEIKIEHRAYWYPLEAL
ncbi:MAG: OmpA family protein [Bacteroidota bacterium]